MTRTCSRTLFFLTVVAGLGLAMAGGLSAQTIGPPVPTWQPNGAVYTVVVDGHTLYAGGAFDQVGPRTGTFAVVDATDSSAVTSGAAVDQSSTVVVADGAGGWFVATGAEPYPGATVPATVLHVLPNGARDPAWAPVSLGFGSAQALAVAGGRLFIGGSFFTVNDVTRVWVAAVDAASGVLLPWDAQLTPTGGPLFPLRLAATASRVYVAANFGSVRGVARNRFAVIDAATAAPQTPVLPSSTFDSQIGGISLTATRAYLRGGCGRNSVTICAFDLDLTPVAGWTFPESHGPFIAGPDVLFVTQSALEPSSRLRVAKLDPDTGAAVAWTAPVLGGGSAPANAAEPAMHLQNNTLYLGGYFTTVNGEGRTRVAAIDATTGTLLPWAPMVSGGVRSVAATAAGVAIGGDFVSVGGVRRQNLVAIDLNSGLPVGNTPAIDMTWVNALVKLGDVMVAAGWRGFASQSPDVVAFSTSTGKLLDWSMASDGQIWALATDGRRMFVGGWFSRLAGQPRRNLASVDLGTGRLTAWNPAPDDFVSRLAVSENTLFAAGAFETLPGYGRRGVAAFSTNTGDVLSFNPPMPAPGVVKGFGFHADRVLLAGEPDGINRGAFRWVERGSGATVERTSPTTPGLTVERTAQVGSTIYAVSSAGLAAIDAASGRTATWDSTWGIGAGSIAASLDYVAIGGSGPNNIFTGQFGLALAVFEAPRAGAPRRITAAISDAAVTLSWQTGPPPAATVFQVEAGTSAGGRELGVFPVGTATRVSGTLSPGAYFVRVRGVGAAGPGAASSEVIVTVPATSTPPNAPGTLSASLAPGMAAWGVVTLRWGAASGNATGYVIEAGAAAGLTNIGALATGTLDTSWSAPAPPGTYVVRVRAANTFGLSAATNEITVVVP